MSRRGVLRTAIFGALGSALRAETSHKASSGPAADEQPTYATHARGIRILPGHWRPHYPFEHIAWVSPSWPSQDYIWLDFPEAIFTRRGLLYLSHVNPQVQPVLFPDQPAVPWRKLDNGIAYERTLPDGIVFGGRITPAENAVDLHLFIRNGAGTPLQNITLQTCFFLRAIAEFAALTSENKFVHVPDRGWIPLPEARKLTAETGRYRIGWRSGPRIADLPIMVTCSSAADRLIACTWGEHTLSLIANHLHPCMHADPRFPDLAPGQSADIRGKLIFFQGSLDQFTDALQSGRITL